MNQEGSVRALLFVFGAQLAPRVGGGARPPAGVAPTKTNPLLYMGFIFWLSRPTIQARRFFRPASVFAA